MSPFGVKRYNDKEDGRGASRRDDAFVRCPKFSSTVNRQMWGYANGLKPSPIRLENVSQYGIYPSCLRAVVTGVSVCSSWVYLCVRTAQLEAV